MHISFLNKKKKPKPTFHTDYRFQLKSLHFKRGGVGRLRRGSLSFLQRRLKSEAPEALISGSALLKIIAQGFSTCYPKTLNKSRKITPSKTLTFVNGGKGWPGQALIQMLFKFPKRTPSLGIHLLLATVCDPLPRHTLLTL